MKALPYYSEHQDEINEHIKAKSDPRRTVEIFQRLLRLLNQVTPDEMENQVHYI